MRYAIPYTMVGGTKFYDRKEIKDVIAYLRLLYNPEDSLSLMRVINVPKRNIGATTIEHLADYAEQNGISLFEPCRRQTISRPLRNGPERRWKSFPS